MKYWPLQLKLGQILLVQKPGKPPHEVTSYRPISLLPRISKILEKLLTARLNSNNILDELLPDHQFGFRWYHSTIQQCHLVIIIIINETLDAKELCPTVFLDIKQAFDQAWHSGYSTRSNKIFHVNITWTLSATFLTHFQIKYGGAFSLYHAK